MVISIVTEIGSKGRWQQYVIACEELNYECRVIEIELGKWVFSHDFKEFYQLI
jgi:hypothetical protein